MGRSTTRGTSRDGAFDARFWIERDEVGDYIGDFGPGALYLTGPNLPHNSDGSPWTSFSRKLVATSRVSSAT